MTYIVVGALTLLIGNAVIRCEAFGPFMPWWPTRLSRRCCLANMTGFVAPLGGVQIECESTTVGANCARSALRKYMSIAQHPEVRARWFAIAAQWFYEAETGTCEAPCKCKL